MGRRHKNKTSGIKSFDRFELLFSIISTCLIIPLIYALSTLDPTLAPRFLFLNIIVLLLFLFSLRFNYSKGQLQFVRGKCKFLLN